MKLTCIVAAAENDVIGRDGQLPWRLPADLKRFKRLTVGKPVIMGRKTWDSIGRPLPDRLNVVLSRQVKELPGAVVAGSLEEALQLPEVASAPEVMVIGGEHVFAEALPRCDTLELTRVHATPEGDAFFRFDPAGWELTCSEGMTPDEKHEMAYTFETWERVRS